MRQGMERGTVDGGSNYMAGIGNQGFAAVTDWVTVLNQGQHTGLVVMNGETWDTLQKAVAAGQERDQQVLDGLFLTGRKAHPEYIGVS